MMMIILVIIFICVFKFMHDYAEPFTMSNEAIQNISSVYNNGMITVDNAKVNSDITLAKINKSLLDLLPKAKGTIRGGNGNGEVTLTNSFNASAVWAYTTSDTYYRITFLNPLPDNNYQVFVSASGTGTIPAEAWRVDMYNNSLRPDLGSDKSNTQFVIRMAGIIGKPFPEINFIVF